MYNRPGPAQPFRKSARIGAPANQAHPRAAQISGNYAGSGRPEFAPSIQPGGFQPRRAKNGLQAAAGTAQRAFGTGDRRSNAPASLPHHIVRGKSPTAAENSASCSGVTASLNWPIAVNAVSDGSVQPFTSGSTLGTTGSGMDSRLFIPNRLE